VRLRLQLLQFPLLLHPALFSVVLSNGCMPTGLTFAVAVVSAVNALFAVAVVAVVAVVVVVVVVAGSLHFLWPSEFETSKHRSCFKAEYFFLGL